MRKLWKYHEPDMNRLQGYRAVLSSPEPILYALDKQNVDDVAGFLNPDLGNLANPHDVPQLSVAAERIVSAIINNEHIVIFGDYDVDGITASTVLHQGIKLLGGRVVNFIPNRLRDGYGFTENSALRCVNELSPDLIITVDCGINSVSTVNLMTERGIPVIITDHHEPEETYAPALAVVNPKIGTDDRLKMLAGVGVAYLLCCGIKSALQRAMPNIDIAAPIDTLLDIVAVGTVADVVPLIDYNRILVYHGLLQMRNTRNVGLKALITQLGLPDDISSQDIGFKIGPRINAAGRIGDPKDALDLFLTDNPIVARDCAIKLDEINTKRRAIEQEVTEDVLRELDASFDPEKDYGLVGVGCDYHAGIVGISAARVMERFNRPTIILNVNDKGFASGSCRSIPAFNILEALHNVKDLLISYGGHAFAAGVKLKVENIDEFTERFNLYAKEKLTGIDITPILQITSVIHESQLTWAFYNSLMELAPFGKDNPEPVWVIKNAKVF